MLGTKCCTPGSASVNFLNQVKSGERIARPVTLVLAHPDDETASAGGLLQRLDAPQLIYLTDGAPRDLDDARREGLNDWRGYAALRKRELESALLTLEISTRPVFYDHPDKQALDHLPRLVDRLARDVAGSEAVITHAYEHGHPDHDTAALAVALACERLGEAAPDRVEFAGYHLNQGGPVYGAFWLGDEELVLKLSARELERKRSAIAAYRSQRETLTQFPLAPERFRPAPSYDFTAPAPPGRALYDLYGWRVTSKRWHSRLAELLA